MENDELIKQVADHAVAYKENHYRLAYSYVKNVDDALDIVQDSICKAISSVDSLKDPGYIKTWFYRIVVNTSLDFLRRQKKVVVADEEVLSRCDAGAVDQYENLDLQRALESLPENYRSVIILRYFEDLKIEEVAQVLQENVNTVKTRLYKSLGELRIKLHEYGQVNE